MKRNENIEGYVHSRASGISVISQVGDSAATLSNSEEDCGNDVSEERRGEQGKGSKKLPYTIEMIP